MAARQGKGEGGGDLAGLFRQRKQALPSKGKSGKTEIAKPQSVPVGSSSVVGTNEESEDVLRKFDMDMRFGPCIGVSRIERWKRAQSLGLNPPLEVKHILELNNGASASLWDGRV